MSSRALILFVLLTATVWQKANAVPTVVLISGEDSILSSEDLEQQKYQKQMIRQWINSHSFHLFQFQRQLNVIDTVEIKVKHPSELKEKFEQELDPGAQVIALYFSGHGNRRLFGFNRYEGWDGEEMAEHTAQALEASALSSTLLFYFSACSIAKKSRNDNFQTVFSKAISEKLSQSHGTAQTLSVAHLHDGDGIDVDFFFQYVNRYSDSSFDINFLKRLLGPRGTHLFVKTASRFLKICSLFRPYPALAPFILGGVVSLIMKSFELSWACAPIVAGLFGSILQPSLSSTTWRVQSELVNFQKASKGKILSNQITFLQDILGKDFGSCQSLLADIAFAPKESDPNAES